ncbi:MULTISPECIES: hypothetical protein [unclassified Enterococcus]|uniref:hypothetical protein n=1 Tax=unclassified Enterococcus TaxID=2608891 RepID=UPI001CE1FF52|nr:MULTISPECIES: hypothetical protein [unclassified Enterococcus]MCA5014124.1 hypothetical protein [Enterococcus sp. S23]MCA5017656.1 hypothetical protein [Enterococcus sp. S22(2020)]
MKPKVLISSVYVKEESFEDYRFIVKKAAEERGYEVVRNPEDSGITQKNFDHIIESEQALLFLLVGKVQSETVLKECWEAQANKVPIFPFMKVDLNGIAKESMELISSVSKELYDNECSCFKTGEDLYKSVIERLDYYENQTRNVEIFSGYVGSYKTATTLIKNGKRMNITFQKTSSLLLGPKRGDIRDKELYDALISEIFDSSANKKTIIYLTNLEETKRSLYNFIYSKAVKEEDSEERLKRWYNYFERFRKITTIPDSNFVIKDTSLVGDEIKPFVYTDQEVFFLTEIGLNKWSISLPQGYIDSKQIDSLEHHLSGIGDLVTFSEIEEKFKLFIDNYTRIFR